MAQLNITLNQEEILQLLTENRGEAFRKMLQEAMNAILLAESTEQLNAEPYARAEGRTDYRNGSRERELVTRVGKIVLKVPRHRNVPFKTLLFDNYSRSESALILCMVQMVVEGVSTRKVSRAVEAICGTSFSKSTVSELCKDLNQSVSDFQNRPLLGEYPFVTVDATYFKVREDRRTISKAFMIALGTNTQGIREVIGFGIYPNESSPTWTDFLTRLRKRGLTGVLMITSDCHEGILNAIEKVFPSVPWQRCQFHFSKNIIDKAPKKYQAGLRTELQEMFNAKDITEARNIRDRIIEDYRNVAESAVSCLDEGFESSMTVMLLPRGMQRYYRTSNHIERLNRELKRRSKVIGIFPNEDSILRLMGSVLIEQNENFALKKAIFSSDSLASLMNSTVPSKLMILAREQQQFRVA